MIFICFHTSFDLICFWEKLHLRSLFQLQFPHFHFHLKVFWSSRKTYLGNHHQKIFWNIISSTSRYFILIEKHNLKWAYPSFDLENACNTEVTVFESSRTAILAETFLFSTLIDIVVFLGWIDHGHESHDGSFQGAYGWTMSPIHLVIMVFSLWEWYDTWNGWIKDIDMVAYKLYNSYVMSKIINNINITAVSTKSLGTISRSFRFWPKSI